MKFISPFGSGIINTTAPQKLLIKILSEFKHFFFKSKLKNYTGFFKTIIFHFQRILEKLIQ